MRELTVAAVQMLGGLTGPPNRSIVDRMIRQTDAAAAAAARVVVFPELALTNYFPAGSFPGIEQARPYFQDLPDELTYPLFNRADQLGVDLIVPFAEWADGRRYNAALVWKAGSGPIGKYRKVHTPRPVEFEPGRANTFEDAWFSAGDGFPTFELQGLRIGVQICFDRHFPESTRSLALDGAEIVFLAANSQSYGQPWRLEIWDALCRIRAYENVVYFVAANKTGREGNMDWHGRSCVVSPGGTILAMANSEEDSVVVATLDLDDLQEQQMRRRFLEERRPGAYRRESSPVRRADAG